MSPCHCPPLPQVCVFYEKQHMQEAVVRKANMELESRLEEIRFLKMEVCG